MPASQRYSNSAETRSKSAAVSRGRQKGDHGAGQSSRPVAWLETPPDPGPLGPGDRLTDMSSAPGARKQDAPDGNGDKQHHHPAGSQPSGNPSPLNYAEAVISRKTRAASHHAEVGSRTGSNGSGRWPALPRRSHRALATIRSPRTLPRPLRTGAAHPAQGPRRGKSVLPLDRQDLSCC